MLFEKIWQVVKAHPFYTALACLVLALIIFAALNGIGKGIETYRANRFDARQKEFEQQIVDLRVQRDAAIKQADIAEANALLKEKEATDLKQMIDAKGGQIAKSAEELEKQIEAAKRDAGTCNGDPDCLCQKLRSVGIACE